MDRSGLCSRRFDPACPIRARSRGPILWGLASGGRSVRTKADCNAEDPVAHPTSKASPLVTQAVFVQCIVVSRCSSPGALEARRPTLSALCRFLHNPKKDKKENMGRKQSKKNKTQQKKKSKKKHGKSAAVDVRGEAAREAFDLPDTEILLKGEPRRERAAPAAPVLCGERPSCASVKAKQARRGSASPLFMIFTASLRMAH